MARVLARATRSRGVARPVPIRPASRSRSYDWPSKLRRSPRRADWLKSSSTASSRSAINSVDVRGDVSHSDKQPRTHRGRRAVDHAQERALALAFPESAHQLQAAPGHLVEGQRVGSAIGDQPGDMAQRRLLGLAQVSQKRPGGLHLHAAIIDAEPGQSLRLELVKQRRPGLLGLEIPRRANRERHPRLASE